MEEQFYDDPLNYDDEPIEEPTCMDCGSPINEDGFCNGCEYDYDTGYHNDTRHYAGCGPRTSSPRL
jgi:hypothetical protein